MTYQLSSTSEEQIQLLAYSRSDIFPSYEYINDVFFYSFNNFFYLGDFCSLVTPEVGATLLPHQPSSLLIPLCGIFFLFARFSISEGRACL